MDSMLSILEHGSIGFTQPPHLNDPHELLEVPPASGELLPVNIGTRSNGDAIMSTMNHLNRRQRQHLTKVLWENGVGVLSLTRDPLNPLMWAHYGNEHMGIVIGFEMDEIPSLSNTRNCIIPYQLGSVIYTKTRPDIYNIQENLPDLIPNSFKHRDLYALQLALLYKDQCWSYEEEVRIVKSLYYQNSNEIRKTFKIIERDSRYGHKRKLFTQSFSTKAVKRIYIGANALRYNLKDIDFDKIFEKYPDVDVYLCFADNKTWGFREDQYLIGKSKAQIDEILEKRWK